MRICLKCRWIYSKNGSSALGNGKSRNYSTIVRKPAASDYNIPHVPVLADQVIKFLKPEDSKLIIDMTFGAGGHTRRFLEKSKTLKIICLDRDPLAYNYAKQLKHEYPDQIIPLHGKFSDLPDLLSIHGINQNSVDGIFFDFGSSSMQFDNPERGFALSKEGPLDMRMDNTDSESVTAADVLAHASENDLKKILKIYGEEVHSKKIASALVEARTTYGKLVKTSQLRDLVAAVLGDEIRCDKLGRYAHSATKVFQALRIFVNNELNEINYGMVVAHRYLKIGGIMVALSFHSLEDTIVKRHITGNVFENVANKLPLQFYSFNTVFKEDALVQMQPSSWRAINKHVILPDAEELDLNPRCRSAKLRACVKIS